MNVENRWQARSRDQIARLVAQDIPEGWCVNLGIGVPTLVANHVPKGREVVFHAENGLLGIGPAPDEQHIDPWIINAGKQYVSLLDGGSYFHHADSFSMIRGGHLDLCVLGAYEVSASGDLANWAKAADDAAPAVGGAMDLAVGAKRVWVAMEHTTRDGAPRIVQKCTYPLTAKGCVKRIYTDLASFACTPQGLQLIDSVAGISHAELEALVGLPILAA